MADVLFSHPTVGDLALRLAPTSVEWTYNMNTSTTQTYAGEVLQILSVNFDTFTISGRFGKEGPSGRSLVSKNRYEPRTVDQVRDYKATGPYSIGLTQMTEYFRDYFAIASQGNDAHAVGHYDQQPMKIAYNGSLDVTEANWSGYPTSFPSYRRSLQDFAPQWQVVFEVEEADYKIRTHVMTEELTNLRNYVGYFPNNKFSDPFGKYDPFKPITAAALKQAQTEAKAEATKVSNAMLDIYNGMLPAYSEKDLEQLTAVSGPAVFNEALQKAGVSNA